MVDWALVALVVVILVHTASITWWAATLTANQNAMKEAMIDFKNAFKEHVLADADFQEDVSEKLGSIKSTLTRPNGGPH